VDSDDDGPVAAEAPKSPGKKVKFHLVTFYSVELITQRERR